MARLSFTTLFNLLLDNFMMEDNKPYTLTEISEHVGISITQLGKYRSGERDNPTIESVISILDFFGMPLSYLDCKSADDAFNMIEQVKTSSLPSPTPTKVLNGVKLSEEAIYQVKEIVTWALARERAIEQGKPEPPLPDFG